MKKIIELAPLAAIIRELEQDCMMLDYVNCNDEDLADLEYYSQRIRRTVDELRTLVKKSKGTEPDAVPGKGAEHE